MFAVLLLSLVACVAIWVRMKWVKVKNFWAERGVPYNPPHPILGSLTFLQKENPAFWLRRLYDQFKAPYVGIWLFWRPGLVVNSPELAKKILVKDADNFRDRFVRSGKSDPLGALNIFTVNEPVWSNIRRRLTSVFTASKLRALEGLIKEKTADLIHRLQNETLKDPEQTNVRNINSDYTTDIIGEAAFGVKSQAVLTGDSAMRRITRDFMLFNVFRGLSWSSIFFLPELVDIFGFSLFPKEATTFLRKLFRSIVEQRGGYDKPVKEPRDLLDALLKLKQEAAVDKEELSEDILLAQAATFLQAGFDTTGATLTWMYKELAHAPDVQEKLFQELEEAKQNYGKELDFSTLTTLPYLNAVIKETLRKYPPMGWLDRISSKDYKMDDKLTIPAGTVIYVNAVGLHYDPDFFPEPEDFDPDRFLPENEKNIKPYTYMPFGEGPRICIGMRFAFLPMRFALATVVQNFSIHPVKSSLPPNEWPVERKGLFLVPVGKMSLVFKPRN